MEKQIIDLSGQDTLDPEIFREILTKARDTLIELGMNAKDSTTDLKSFCELLFDLKAILDMEFVRSTPAGYLTLNHD